MKRKTKEVKVEEPESEDSGNSDESEADSMIDNGTDESCSEDEAGSEEEPAPKKAKGITVAEIHHLEETENMYHSNLFRMQIEELLAQVKKPRESEVADWLAKFNRCLKGMEAVPEKSFEELSHSDVTYPLDTKVQDVSKCGFAFVPPEEEAVLVGAQRLGTNVGEPVLTVDVAVTMPFELSKKDDFMNQKILHKKAFYLQTIARNLLKARCFEGLKYNLFRNDQLRPVLEVEAAQGKVKFVIHVLMHEDSFKLHRFQPSNNNVRSYMVLQESGELPPTPHYNLNLLFDLTLSRNQDFLEQTIGNSRGLRDAIVLLKIWLRQRHLSDGFYGGFSGHLVTCLVCLLLKSDKIATGMSSYQIIRLVWLHLAASKWETEGASLCSFSMDVNRPALEDFHRHFEVVFVDCTGYCNIAGHLSLDLYSRVRQESQRAIQSLDRKDGDSFGFLFIRAFPVFTQFDHILTVKNFNVVTKIVESSPLETRLDFIDNWFPLLRHRIMPVLHRGLGSRVTSLIPFSGPTSPWGVSESRVSKLLFLVGINLNPEEALGVVDKGPQANETEAAKEFREFWGDKAELRRFKDGSITESCVWMSAESPVGERRMVCRSICLHLLKRHFDVPEVCMHYLGDQFDVAIRRRGVRANETGEEKTLDIIQTFNRLAKELRGISSIPLSINKVVGTDPVFRYCDLEVPNGDAKTFKFMERDGIMAAKSLRVVFELASSGKWPDDIKAFRTYKTEFYLQIAKALEESALKPVVQVFEDFFYVLLDGFVFRLEMSHPKEVIILRQYLDPNKITKRYKDTPQSIKLEVAHQLLPKLSSSLHGLHSQFSSFGPAVNMVNRWLNSQLLDAFLWPPIATELLMAHLYLKQHEVSPPVQPQTAFFRLLHFLSTSNFTTELVVANFNEALDQEKLKELDSSFTASRSSFPPLCIATSCDNDKTSIWTKTAPSEEILRHVQSLAKATIEVIKQDLTILCPKKIKPIFTPSLDGFNVIIHLKEDALVPSYTVPVDRFTTLKLAFDLKKLQAVDFNAAQCYLKDLRRAYDEFALFFYDPCEGSKVAVLWKPKAFEPKPFKMKFVYARRKEGQRLVPNLEVIIQDFELLGEGFVEGVEVLSDQPLM